MASSRIPLVVLGTLLAAASLSACGDDGDGALGASNGGASNGGASNGGASNGGASNGGEGSGARGDGGTSANGDTSGASGAVNGGADGGEAGAGGAGGKVRGDGSVSGDLKQWHRVAVTFDGPQASEGGNPNPFTDYRMAVTFTSGSTTVTVPGHFAADGDAANSGATSGDQWRVYFMPPSPGDWTYTTTFVSDTDAALKTSGGTPVTGIDGASGSFTIGGAGTEAADLRTRGLLQHLPGERYLRFAGNGKVYIEGGVDSPENLLAYADIDNTIDCPGDNSGILHEYPTHTSDWQSGDPTWAGGKGKALIGAINYLATTGVNAQYLLTMTREHNGTGDDNRIFPWTGCDERFRFDVSKLDQWEVVFEHMTRRGLMVHILTQETENDHLLDGGALGRERTLYYRELISRFSHHPALQWNLGEENTNDPDDVKDWADYFDETDPYRHPTFLHTYPNQQEQRYRPLIGHDTFHGATLQFGSIPESAAGGLYGETRKWLTDSAASPPQWVVTATEASGGQAPTPNSSVTARQRVYWMYANIMAGGGGFEWYLKRGGAGHAFDHSLEDFKEFDDHWQQSGHAVAFFRDVVAPALDLQVTEPGNDLTTTTTDWVLAAEGTGYLLYLREGGATDLDLSSESGTFQVTWFNPRTGATTEATTIEGGAARDLGTPPAEATQDWVVFVRK